MRLRYAGTCRICACELPKGADAVYELTVKAVRCVTCADPVVGESAEVVGPAPEVMTEVDSGATRPALLDYHELSLAKGDGQFGVAKGGPVGRAAS